MDPDEQSPGPLELLDGARDEAYRLGYRLEVFWAGHKAQNSEHLAKVLYNRGIRGVIWAPMPFPHPPISFPWENFAPIACTQSAHVSRLPTVNINHSKGMALLIQELDKRGARRIGFVGEVTEEERLDFGWLTGIELYRRRGGDAEVLSLMVDSKSLQSKKNVAWLRRRRHDAIIISHPFYPIIKQLGINVPLASLDVPKSELGRCGGLYQDSAQIGRHAVRSLAIRLTNGILGLPKNTFSVVTDASFVNGESLQTGRTFGRE